MNFTILKSTDSYTFLSFESNMLQNNVLVSITDELISIYEKYFGIVPNPFNLINTYDMEDAPIVYKSFKTIFTCCPTSNPLQFVYQLSHELCHWMIPENVHPKLKWLDETIAVSASFFFSSRVTILPKEEIVRYLNSQMQNIIPVQLNELFIANSSTLQILEHGSTDFTDYARYKSISLYMINAIQHNPLFWKAVPYLCNVTPEIQLQKSIDFWLSLLPDESTALALINVFNSLR